MDHTKAKTVLAARLRSAFDDLFAADKEAEKRSATQLKGWFKTKTGVGDAVAEKMASTFKSLADYADWTAVPAAPSRDEGADAMTDDASKGKVTKMQTNIPSDASTALGLVYRFEIHLPDTANVDTFRAIFRAIKEELL